MVIIEKVSWIDWYETLSSSFSTINSDPRLNPLNITLLKHTFCLSDDFDHSFIIKEQGRVVACCPLFRHQDTLGFFHLPSLLHTAPNTPLSKNVCKNIKKYLEPKPNLSLIIDDDLLSNIFDNIVSTETYATAFVDLNLSLQEIKSSIRKSYRSLLSWGAKNFIFHLKDASNTTVEELYMIGQYYSEVSSQAFDRVYWDIIFNMIKEKSCFITKILLNDKLVGISVFKNSMEESIYSIGAYDKELMLNKCPIGHYSIYKSIEHAKQAGYKKLNLGFIKINEQSEKDRSIFSFKKAFATNMELCNVARLDFTF